MSIGYRAAGSSPCSSSSPRSPSGGWPTAPARTLIFSRDLPRLTHPLPRYLPPDTDRALLAALNDLSATAPATATDCTPTRCCSLPPPGCGSASYATWNWTACTEIVGHGAWLKVPLGKLASERMVPIDEETLAVIDRIVARRTPGRPLPHPRTGRHVEFLLMHQGRRVSACALREELARAASTPRDWTRSSPMPSGTRSPQPW